MIKEIKAWVAKLEATINELAKTYDKPVEEVEEAWERFWYEDGPGYDENWEGHSIEVFKKTYRYLMEDGEYAEPDDTESEYTRSSVTIQPIVGADKTFFYIKEDLEGHTGECFDMDKEGIERLKQVVHGREIDWVNGYNATTDEELTVVEFNRYVNMYLNSCRMEGDIYQKMREYADRRDYMLSDGEIETIVDQCEVEGDSIFNCSDGMLREIVEDWVADHSCLGR